MSRFRLQLGLILHKFYTKLFHKLDTFYLSRFLWGKFESLEEIVQQHFFLRNHINCRPSEEKAIFTIMGIKLVKCEREGYHSR